MGLLIRSTKKPHLNWVNELSMPLNRSHKRNSWKGTKKYWDEICQECHNHSELPSIFKYLYEISEGNSFIINTFILVLFHQSLYGIRCYRPMKELTDEEIKEYIPQDTLDMFDILLNADSHAYTIVGVDKSTIRQFKEEISKEIQRIKSDIFSL